ncbi:MAG TPA: BadF/BadG/BcrA/BcrD ATPase family protein [Methylomirabilota bacterium]|nr:BadF/BadG/BcrA/BcrD ATPase family protein [Methylomirabilota bacterium]
MIRQGKDRVPAIAVGVDLGATWLRAQAMRGDRPLARFTARAAPVGEVGSLFRALWRRRSWTARTVGALVVASRGVWTAGERRALARRLGNFARRVVVLSDAQAAHLGALGERPGVLILSGTGSIVIGRNPGGRWARAGGLGPLLGDEGSAFWLGQQWLRITSRGEDFRPARRLVTGPDAVVRVAALAPAVIRRARRGDARARAIVRAGQGHLAAQAADVAKRLRLGRPVTLSWAGSVCADAWFRAGLKRAVRLAGLPAHWQSPCAEPVAAAAGLAGRLAAHERALPARGRRASKERRR